MNYAKVICVYLEYEYDLKESLEAITDVLSDKYISFTTDVVSEITDYKL